MEDFLAMLVFGLVIALSCFYTCDINIDRSKMHAIKMSLRGWNNAISSSRLNCKFQIRLRPLCLSCGWMKQFASLYYCDAWEMKHDMINCDNMFCFKRIEIWKRNECWWRLQICLVEMIFFHVGDHCSVNLMWARSRISANPKWGPPHLSWDLDKIGETWWKYETSTWKFHSNCNDSSFVLVLSKRRTIIVWCIL